MVQTIEKDMKLITLFSILVTAVVISACSSGGTGAEDGLNVSGRWSGAVTTRSGFIQATMTLSQDRVITPGTDTAEVDGLITVVSPSCSYSFSFENAEVNGRTNTISIGAGDEVTFIGNASNSEIVGNFNFFGDEGSGDLCQVIAGPARFTR